MKLTAIVEREGDVYVALCPQFDVASQGSSIEDAIRNLTEAVELFLDHADADEIQRRTKDPALITEFEVSRG